MHTRTMSVRVDHLSGKQAISLFFLPTGTAASRQSKLDTMNTIRSLQIVIALSSTLIRALPPNANDVDSIAKLFNNNGPTIAPFAPLPPTIPSPPGPPSPPDTPRQSSLFGFGFGRLSQIPSTSPSPPPQFPGQSRPSSSNSPSLNLPVGPVSGRRLMINLEGMQNMQDIKTNECHVFLGIPYAAAPTGDLRFKAPKPAPRWSSTLDGLKYKSACMQDSKALPKSWSISEDCLHVNVFKPAVSTPVPIVVWIHGGAFLTGSATTINPTTACRQVVVNTVTVVTINYRLGSLGFPAHDSLSPQDTNLGLRDIALAIKWVQDNAVALGSQTDRIVLAGHGGGAALVSHLLDSGLINLQSIKGVILMSGSGLAPWAVTKHSWGSTASLLHYFNCQSMECLQKIDASRLMDMSTKLWSPYVDNTTITASDGRKIESRRTVSNFPIIMGFTLQEGTALAVQKLASVNGQPLKEKITRSLVEFTGESREEVERRYLYERSVPVDFFENIFDFIDALSEAYSDLLFRVPSIKEATLRTQLQSSNVYVYSIRHDVPLPGNSLPGYKASYHGSDLELFWSPYAKQSRVNLLGAFLQVLLHPQEDVPWHPWSPQSPMVLQVTPYGGQIVNYRPHDSAFYNQTFYNTTAKYGMGWTANPPRKFTLINSNTTAVPVLFGKKKIGPSTPSFWSTPTTPTSIPSPSSTPNMTTTTAQVDTTTVSGANLSSTAISVNKTVNITNFAIEFGTKETTTAAPQPNTTFATATKPPAAPRANNSSDASPAPPAASGQQDSLVWVLLGLAVLFLFLFLITVGGCAAWNRQSYHPHPNRRSRHQGAKVRSGQARVPPPVAPLETPSASHQPPSHPPRSHRDGGNSEGKKSGHRMISHNQVNNQSGNVTAAHRRPRQPPPSLPPLLTKDPKRT